MTPLIRILLVDDNPDIHDVVKRLIGTTNDIVLVGEAFTGPDATALCKELQPDLVLMDVVLPGQNGAETTAAILKHQPATRIVALSSYHEYEYIRAMLDSGVIGYLIKNDIAQDLLATIRNTMHGNTVLSPQVAQTVLATDTADSPVPDFGLTDRELQVLTLMADGLTYSGIAHQLRISQPTVRFHLNNILEKLDVETRSEALVLAAKNHLV